MSGLLPILASVGESTIAAPQVVVQSGDHLHFDGNSITNGFLASSVDVLVKEYLATKGITVTTSHTGRNGQTWDDMADGPGDVAYAYDNITGTGKRWLVVSETTNAVFNTNQTAAQCLASARRCIAVLRSQRPWDRVIGWSSIPRGHADWVTYPDEQRWNEALIDVDAAMSADPADLGLDCWIDARTVPQFAHDGHDPAAFASYQAAWNEGPPDVSVWSVLGWTHPKDGTFDPPTGKRAIARAIGEALILGV